MQQLKAKAKPSSNAANMAYRNEHGAAASKGADAGLREGSMEVIKISLVPEELTVKVQD